MQRWHPQTLHSDLADKAYNEPIIIIVLSPVVI